MSIKIYEILCSIYKKIFSRIENLFLKDNKIKKNNELFDFKFFNNIKIRKIEYENFEKIETNKYLQKIIFPRQVIKDLIIDLFQKEKIAEKITNITGFKYQIDFFTAYETYQIKEDDIEKGWYANHYHKDKPYSSNMIKLIFSFEKITENSGPMEVKFFDKIDQKEKIFQVILDKSQIFLFNPVSLFHRATSPKQEKRFQIMMQLNPAKFWRVNQNIFQKQKYREPKFPFFYYIFDKNSKLEKIQLR